MVNVNSFELVMRASITQNTNIILNWIYATVVKSITSHLNISNFLLQIIQYNSNLKSFIGFLLNLMLLPLLFYRLWFIVLLISSHKLILSAHKFMIILKAHKLYWIDKIIRSEKKNKKISSFEKKWKNSVDFSKNRKNSVDSRKKTVSSNKL